MPGLNRPSHKRNRDGTDLKGITNPIMTRKSDYPVVAGVPYDMVPYVCPCGACWRPQGGAMRNPGKQPLPSYKAGNPHMKGGY